MMRRTKGQQHQPERQQPQQHEFPQSQQSQSQSQPSLHMRSRKSYESPVGTDDDFEAGYFTYRPLSNLPTPPLSSRNSYASSSPVNSLAQDELLKPKYLGPAVHLANLIPPSASLATPSVPLVQAVLTRSGLSLETVALAVCILDSLDCKRFARRWRTSCPLIDFATSPRTTTTTTSSWSCSSPRPPPLASSPAVNFPPSPAHSSPVVTATPDSQAGYGTHSRTVSQTHIDAVQPELIIMAALIVAVKFTQDPQEPVGYYCTIWGGDMWSKEQVNATERCLMEVLDYRIMPLCDEDLISDAMVDMRMAGRFGPPQVCWGGVRDHPTLPAADLREASGERGENEEKGGSDDDGHDDGFNGRAAVVGLGLQTPPARQS